MSYLLYVSVSPQGDRSVSRNLANDFLDEYRTKNPDTKVVERDLAVKSVPHLDGETLGASYSPVENHTPSMAEKFKVRMDLINEFKGAKEILVSTPMWNWNVPSVFKAYIDHLIFPGVLGDGTPENSNSAKVTVIAAQGGSYAPGTPREGWDWLTGYLKQVFTQVGSKDVKIILSELNYAGWKPGMENLVGKKEASLAEAKKAIKSRV